MRCIHRPHCAFLTLFLVLLLAACSGDDGPISWERGDEYGNVTAAEPNPLPLASPKGCVIDDDCQSGTFCFHNTCAYVCASDADCDGATCSDRGKCIAGEGALTADIVETLPNIEIVEFPPTVYSVSDTDQHISFTFKLNAELPAEGLAYRVWRSDSQIDETKIHHARGDDAFTITLAAGAASPTADEPRGVAITLFTSIGDIDLYLTPEPAFAGVWAGEAKIEEFGGQSFAMEVHLLGEDTDELKLALPLSRASLFAPHRDFDADGDFQIVDLNYHPSLNAYQAVFQHIFDSDRGLFSGLPQGQVERVLRIDLDADALDRGELQGRFLDLWTGIYDHQRLSGLLEAGELLYTGDIVFRRTGDLPSGVDYQSGSATDYLPALVGLQPLDHCEAVYFDVDPVTAGDQTFHCDAIDSSTDFEEADSSARTLCAVAVSRSVDQQETTADQLSAYFTDEGNINGLSFEQFLQSCADDTVGPCQPRPEARCAFELTAHAARDAAGSARDALLREFVASSREAFLARQLGAFFTDMDLRRQWLRQSSAPTVFLNQVEQANLDLLDEWQVRVLDVHAEIFADFFRPNALTAMGRATDNAEINELRRALLLEASTLWRTYAGALQLAAQRWDDVLKEQDLRDQRVADLQSRAHDLYLSMGLLTEFSRAAGAGAQSAVLASDFAALTEAIHSLSQSFDDALFARDAEVVTARSLDPLSDNESLLSERRQAALDAIDDARQGIDEILDEADIEALQEQEIRNRLENERRDAANAIVRICGLPRGCSEDDLLTDPSCVDVSPGGCGLLDPADPASEVTFDPQRVAASQAGSAVLDVLEAFHNVRIQKDELEGHLAILDLEYQELNAFRRDVEGWNQLRLSSVRQLEQNLAQRQRFRDDRIEEMMENIEERSRLRQDTISLMNERIGEWNQMRVAGANSTFSASMESLGVRNAASSAELLGAQAAALLDAKAESLPTVTGPTVIDASGPLRSALWLAARGAEYGGQHTGARLSYNADVLDARSELSSALGSATLAAMQEQAEVTDAIGNAELDAVIEQMEVSNQLTDDEIARLEGIIELMQAQLEAELAYGRDMAEFRARRSAHLQNHIDTSGKLLRLEHSRFNVMQRTAEYDALVQQARLEASRLNELDQQLTNLDQLVGGLGVIFSQSHHLEQAERHLNQARDALMDWLVVLEYYAVRPFFAERTQILLARNAFQLEAIAERLQDLERSCGGSERSSSTAVLSLRRDILGLTRAVENDTTAGPIEAQERFRRWLSQSHIPVDRRLRWSTSSSLAHVLERTDGVLAATFSLSLDNFANLTLACNAKIESISAQITGEVGEVRPTVSLLYDGTSQLRSCQPDLDTYVEAFGQGLTSYGTITNLRTAGRSMSPLAGVNEFPNIDRDANRTLAGLPVASEYTLLIDTTLGDNASVDWTQIEDIQFEVTYSYQDLFPTSCD